MRYQTEVFVAADRYVCLQLPDYLPEGRAIVTVTVATSDDSAALAEPEDERPDDVEWWEEFDDEESRRG